MLEIKQHYPLKAHHTFGIDVSAALFAEASHVEDLIQLLNLSEEKNLPLLILGGGSNVLFTQDFEGLVVKNNLRGVDIIKETDQHIWLKVGAGENWHEIVRHCVDNHFGGIENLALIPGTVGAAPMQNIGAYGVELKSTFESLQALNKKTHELETFDNKQCQFDYRSSIFKTDLKNQYIICSVTLKLSKTPQLNTAYRALQEALSTANLDKPTIKDIYQTVIAIRQSKLPDPRNIGNAGSFFKNSIIPTPDFLTLKTQHPDMPSFPAHDNFTKVPAAWLIEHCGFKGKRHGDAGVHDQQALVLVNHGNARGADILALAKDIQQAVKQQFNITLQPEVNVV